jgi:large subunit ribosomal protein L3
MSIGLIGKKLGMTHVYDESGHFVPVTVVQAGPCSVTQIKDKASDGYRAVQIGYGEVRETKLTQPQLGHLGDLGPLRHLREFRIAGEPDVSVGDTINASQFVPGQQVTVTGTSKGKGFAGSMKRHGFHGGKRTHGQSDRERAPGSVGAGTTPGRVFKGTRMAGHLGSERVSVKNVTVVQIDETRNLVLVKGPVPGYNGAIVLLRPGSGS